MASVPGLASTRIDSMTSAAGTIISRFERWWMECVLITETMHTYVIHEKSHLERRAVAAREKTSREKEWTRWRVSIIASPRRSWLCSAPRRRLAPP